MRVVLRLLRASTPHEYLADEIVADERATKSYVGFRPLGIVLAIMPWNFPYWQVFPRRRARAHGRQRDGAQTCIQRFALRA